MLRRRKAARSSPAGRSPTRPGGHVGQGKLVEAVERGGDGAPPPDGGRRESVADQDARRAPSRDAGPPSSPRPSQPETRVLGGSNRAECQIAMLRKCERSGFG